MGRRIQVGNGGINRISAGRSVRWSGKGQWHASNGPETPNETTHSPPENASRKGNKNGEIATGGKGMKKWKGKGKRITMDASPKEENTAHAPKGSNYLGKRYDPNFQQEKGNGEGGESNAEWIIALLQKGGALKILPPRGNTPRGTSPLCL